MDRAQVEDMQTSASASAAPAFNIEDTPVHEDPRKWSKGRKNFTLATVSCASLLLTLAISIYNPAINDIVTDLHSTYRNISWTLSVHALVTGCAPLAWGAFTELYGRKAVYLVSISLFIIGSGIAGSSKSIGLLIAMRVIQGIGGSAVLTIGAATLADIYEPSERGSVMGLYYAAPLLGPSLGPLIGGIATKLFSWRATFYVLAIFGAVPLLAFVFFKDTFRRERSLAYQAALRKVTLDSTHKNIASENEKSPTIVEERPFSGSKQDLEFEGQDAPGIVGIKSPRVGLRQMQTFQPIFLVIRRPNNLCVLGASALMFSGISYCLPFTAVRTFGSPPYNYNSLKLGLVLLSFGIGNMVGSLTGGRWSDRMRRKLQAEQGGVSKSEHRLHSTKLLMPVLISSLIAYAWMADKKVNIGGICVVLFLVGFSSIWIYTSLLAYIVDANSGRSSSAVSINSFFRGVAAFIAAEIAIPLQDALGDGGLYTLMAGIMIIECSLILLVIAKELDGAKQPRRERPRKLMSNPAGENDYTIIIPKAN